MFGWFKKKPTVDAQQKETFMRHIEKAEGSAFLRSMIAEAMCSVEEEAVTNQRNKRPDEEGQRFITTYQCFIAYALKTGVERVLGPDSFREALEAIGLHFIKHADFFPDLFLNVWSGLDESMSSPPAIGEVTPDEPIGKLMIAAYTNKTLFPN